MIAVFNTIVTKLWGLLLLGTIPMSAISMENDPNYAVSLIPQALIQRAHTVVRNEDYRVKVLSYNKIEVTRKYAATLINDNSDVNTLVIPYNSFTKIYRIRGRIFDAEGKLVRELNQREIKDNSAVSGFSIYEDSRIKHVEVDYHDYPYTVEFEYKYALSNYMYYPQWNIQPYGVAIEQATFTVETIDLQNLNYRAVNIDLAPAIEQKNGKHILTFLTALRPAINKVNYGPDAEKVLPFLLLAPNRFRLGKHDGDMSTWQSFGQFINQLNEGRDIVSDEMADKVKTMTASAQTDREKIDILYDYLQENTRYVSVQLGVGGWQTFDAAYVEKNKYGDCKALTYFMKAMLKEVGITAYPVLISSGRSDALIMEDFVYPGFNHVILNIPSENYWLECTSSYSPPNFIGAGNDSRTALRLSSNGGELITTPGFTPNEVKEENKAMITIMENGDATIKNSCTIEGPWQNRYRVMSYEATKEDQYKWFAENCGLPSVFVNELSITPDDRLPTVVMDYDVDVIKYAAKSGKRLFVPLNPINTFKVVPEKMDRQAKVVVDRGYMLNDEITLLLPEGFEIESSPEDSIALSSPYGTYTAQLRRDTNQVTLIRRLDMQAVTLPPEEYDAFRDFRKKISKLDAAKLVLVKKKT